MNKKIIFTSILVLSSLATSITLSSNRAYEANASAYSTSSVPTTIDLNDSSDSEIRSYYSSLSSLGESERKGTNLLKNLKPILKNGQKYFSYGSSASASIWKAYEIVDRDWDKSPASGISGYDASTNKITGYKYGTSNSNPGTNPYVHALYVNRNVENETKAWGNHNQDQWGINQEHIWAKSLGFEDESHATGARGDLMHLWAGNGKVNGSYHINYYYGNVDTSKDYKDASSYASTLSGNKLGSPKSVNSGNKVFEPQDSDKGDIARALFYMAARYNNISGVDEDGIDSGNPNLEIVNDASSWQSSGYSSNGSETGKMGIIQDLLEWNRLDPPDEWEIHRNNLCYKNFTGNRNPFIDFPEWAEYVWGSSSSGKYDSDPTGSASPTDNIINKFKSDETDAEVVSLSWDKLPNKIEYAVGDSFLHEGSIITAAFADGTSKNVADECVFTPEKFEEAGNEIEVSAAYKGKTASIKVNVAAKSAPSSSDQDSSGKIEDNQEKLPLWMIIAIIAGAVLVFTAIIILVARGHKIKVTKSGKVKITKKKRK